MECFIVFGIGRSGSRLLVDILGQHPGLACHDGVFPADSRLREALTHAAVCARRDGAGAFGVRLLVPHLETDPSVDDVPGFVKILAAEGWRILHVRRATTLRTILSYLHADQRGFHVTTDDGSWRFEPINVDADELLEWFQTVSRWRLLERAALTGQPALTVVYERDLAEPRAQAHTLSTVASWLGLDGDCGTVEPVSRFVRQIPDLPWPALVSNYEKIAPLLHWIGTQDT